MAHRIRMAQPEDINALKELMREYITDFYGNPWPGDDSIQVLIESLLQRQTGIQLLVEDEGHPIGFATLYYAYSTMRANKIAIMNDLYLLEPYRDTRAEIDLFNHCRSFTQEQGCSYMSWVTGEGNTRAQRFFDKAGAARGKWVNYSIV